MDVNNSSSDPSEEDLNSNEMATKCKSKGKSGRYSAEAFSRIEIPSLRELEEIERQKLKQSKD